MFEYTGLPDLIRIAAAGGGFKLNAAHRTTEDLIRIAAAARTKGARITFSGMEYRTVTDLVRIAAAGGGSIVFEE